MTTMYHDQQLLKLDPALLLDMKGGNIRRKEHSNKAELTESIRTQGILQNLVARPLADGTFELLAGYGRRNAALEVGLKEVPVQLRMVDDETALHITLTENVQRSDLSFVEQVDWAVRFMSFYQGNVASAAQRLGWTETKLRERLVFSTCVPEVLDALDDGKIQVKHALILSSFDKTVQTRTLTKVIDEKWSITDLKMRADRVNVPLSKAIFDQADCADCAHNTGLQAGLFGSGADANCSKSSCFHQKTKDALEAKKVEAEERFGTVLWLSQSLPEHRVSVSAVAVGEQQYTTGCMACEKRVVVMDDSANNPGSLLEGQCTDKACFAQCVTSHETAKVAQASEPASAPSETVAEGKTATSKAKASQPKTESTAVNTKAPNVVVEQHWDELRDLSAAMLNGNDQFTKAMQVLGLIVVTGFKAIPNPNKALANLMTKDQAALDRMTSELIEHALTKSKQLHNTDSRKVLGHVARCMDNGEANLVKAWVPTEVTLSKYTISGLEALVNQSGLAAHVGEEGVKKLFQGNKKAVITAILAVEFDWSAFAPQAFLDNVKAA